jgi:hypothetical protein
MLFSRNRTTKRHRQAVAASPAAAAGAPTREMLFVQSFESGSIAAKDADGSAHVLTVRHGLGQTLAFSDRPGRIVDVVPTSRFLDGLGFSPDNPPNAALVVHAADGGIEVAVLELTNPTYDETTSTAAYDITLLAGDDASLGMRFEELATDFSALPATFGSAHLFIDDCPDVKIGCIGLFDNEHKGFAGTAGACWDWSDWSCKFCDPDAAYHSCNDTVPACDRTCWASEDFG